MIEIDTNHQTYVCPFCGARQAYHNSYSVINNGFARDIGPIQEQYKESSYSVYSLYCNNELCQRVTVTAINRTTHKQVDIVPQTVLKQYPEYIPKQIRMDYQEASQIIEISPKAAATLFRRCLQGMIHDFWNIHEKNLNAEITALKNKVSLSQWTAIDGIRQIGNIGAHMEHDVNKIIDIDSKEAVILQNMIELLLDKWYIAKHDEDTLYAKVQEISMEKQAER